MDCRGGEGSGVECSGVQRKEVENSALMNSLMQARKSALRQCKTSRKIVQYGKGKVGPIRCRTHSEEKKACALTSAPEEHFYATQRIHVNSSFNTHLSQDVESKGKKKKKR